MKKNRIYKCHGVGLYAMLLFITAVLCSCKDDDGPSLTSLDIAGGNFSGTWVVDENLNNSVTYNSIDSRTEYYKDFAITIDYISDQKGGNFSTTGGHQDNSPWPTSGLWSFVSDDPSGATFQVERDDLLLVDVTIEETNLILSFNFDENDNKGGRTEAVSGNWTFRLIKQ